MNVTFTITSPPIVGKTMIGLGEVVKIKEYKRLHLQVTKTDKKEGEEIYIMIQVYKPSPKSTLRNKSLFSKFKGKLIK